MKKSYFYRAPGYVVGTGELFYVGGCIRHVLDSVDRVARLS